MTCTESTRNNCRNAPHSCWHCENGSQYHAINPNIQSCWHKARAEERKAAKLVAKQTATSRKARQSKRKGNEGEREVVKLLEKYGIKAERQLLSGAAGEFNKKWAGDVTVESPFPFAIEVKRRKDALKTVQNRLYNESGGSGIVRVGDIAVMPHMAFISLLQGEKVAVEEQPDLAGINTVRSWLTQSEHTPVVFYRSDGDTSRWVVGMWMTFYNKLRG